MRHLFAGRARPVGLGLGLLVQPARGGAAPIDPSKAFAGVAGQVLAGLEAGPLAEVLAVTLRQIVAGEIAGCGGRGGGLSGLAGRRQGLAAEGLSEASVQAWAGELGKLLQRICRLAHAAKGEGIVVSVPLVSLAEDAAGFVAGVIGEVLAWSAEVPGTAKPGSGLAAAVEDLLLKVSGVGAEEAMKRPQRLRWPEAGEADAVTLTKRYLGGTPLERLLLTRVPFRIVDENLYTSFWIMAGIGHGKTQALQNLIGQFLDRHDPPSLVVVDSAGELLANIGQLKVFAPGQRLAGRLILLDPRELERPLALNPFARGQGRLGDCPPHMREQLENGVVSVLEYLLGAVLSAELTQKQSVLFRYLVRLLMIIPGASIRTLLDILDEPERFAGDLQRLGGSARRFLEGELFGAHFRQTRKEIT